MNLPFEEWRRSSFSFRDAVWRMANNMLHMHMQCTVNHRLEPAISSQPIFAIKSTKLKDSANVCQSTLAQLLTAQHIDHFYMFYIDLAFLFTIFMRFISQPAHKNFREKKQNKNTLHYVGLDAVIRWSMKWMHFWFTCDWHFDVKVTVYLQRNEMTWKKWNQNLIHQFYLFVYRM